MTQSDLIKLLTEPFYDNFAASVAGHIRTAEDLALLYDAVTSPPPLGRADRHKVLFRGAYVLDTIYFDSPERFAPFVARFCDDDFPTCTDPSARRHFTKIMAHLLKTHRPRAEALERIADSAGDWVVDPASKVAVRIGAVEVLRLCRPRVEWVNESWADLLEALGRDATPGIRCWMRKNWKEQ